MGKRSRRKKRARQNQVKRLKKLLAGGKLYLNMESKEWQTGMFNGLDIKGRCVGYRVPKGTTAEEEAAIVKKWREIDAIYNGTPIPEKSQPKPKKKKQQQPPPPRKKQFRLQVAHVELELVGTEL